MKICKLLCIVGSLLLVFSCSLAVKKTAEPKLDPSALCNMLQAGVPDIAQRIMAELTDKELVNLSLTCRSRLIQQELHKRWIKFGTTHTVTINCSDQRKRFADNKAFKKHILETMKAINAKNPQYWMKLNLGNNDIDDQFLVNLIPFIIDQAEKLHIDIVTLALDHNHLTKLPENLFKRFSNLQELVLNNNQLANISKHSFNGLSKLEQLWLTNNQLTTLDESLFNGLNHLKKLMLGNNRLVSLPENLFRGLKNLQYLALIHNQLQKKTNQELHLDEHVQVDW